MSRIIWLHGRKTELAGIRAVGSVMIWLPLLTLLAFLVRTIRLDFQPLWWDEGWSLYFATADIPTMIARTAIDIHPPFYYLLLHGWILVTGSTVVSVRLLSVLMGTVSVPLVFLLGRRILGIKVGAVAAMALAITPFHVYYSQETRMYALVALLVLASMCLFVSLLEGKGSTPIRVAQWVSYVVVTSLAMYTQYYAAFIPISQTIFMLVRVRRYRALLLKWVGAQVVLLLCYLPWLVYAGGKLVQYVGTKLVKEGDVPVGLGAYVQQHLVAFSVGHLGQDRVVLSWLAVVFVALAVLGIVGYARSCSQAEPPAWTPRYAVVLALIYLALPILLGYLINLRYPFTSPGIQRLLLLSAPAFYLLVALGLTWIWERSRLLWPLCLLLIALNAMPLFDFYSVARSAPEDYRPLIKRVQALARPNDIIVAVHPWQIGYFHAYYVGQLPLLYLTPKQGDDVTREEWAAEPGLMSKELDRLLAEHRLLWLPTHQTLGRILENDMEGYLSQGYYPLFSQWFSDSTKLGCYTAGQDLELVQERMSFEGKVSLLAYGVTSRPVEAGWDALLMELRWGISGRLDGEYQIAFRLADESGNVWVAEDSQPVGGLRAFDEQPLGSEMTDRHGLSIPAGLPPGAYDLRLGLYRLEDGQWLDIIDGNGSHRGVEMVLGQIEVRAPASPPPLASLPIQDLRQADFGPGLRLLGYSIGSESPRPGDALTINLFWQALADLRDDYHVSLQLQDGAGRTLASTEGPPGGASYPTSAWRRGQLVRDPRSLQIPARVPSGRYLLNLGVYDSADGRPVSVRRWGLKWGESVALRTITVAGRAHPSQPPPSVGHPVSWRLGEAVQLIGYEVDRQTVGPGDSLLLTLYWQALSEMDTSYTVFTHLIDEQGHIWGQRDGIPGEGLLPTSSWLPGEYVTDEYEIPVRADCPSGQYTIEIGMYDLATMVRLTVFDEQETGQGDRILLEATPIIVGP